MFYNRDFYMNSVRDPLQRWAFSTGNDDVYWNAEDLHRCNKEDDYECNWEGCPWEEMEGQAEGSCWHELCYSEKCDDFSCTRYDLVGEDEWVTSPCDEGNDMEMFDMDFDMYQEDFNDELMKA